MHLNLLNGFFKPLSRRNAVLAAVVVLSGVFAQGQALAQSGGIKLMVGFPPGGGTDAIARILADKLKDQLGVSVVVECGQHFLQSSSDLAINVAKDFIAHFGLIQRDAAAPAKAPQQRFELLQTWVVKHADFRFARPLVGFETFAKGELVANDGGEELRAPCDDCTILMPTREPIVGREGVYLSRPML